MFCKKNVQRLSLCNFIVENTLFTALLGTHGTLRSSTFPLRILQTEGLRSRILIGLIFRVGLILQPSLKIMLSLIFGVGLIFRETG